MTVRADSGFWSWKLIDRLDAHRIALVDHRPATTRSSSQRSPTSPTTPGSTSTTPSAATPRSPKPPTPPADAASQQRTVRLVVRRTRLTDTAQRTTLARLATPRLHHQPTTTSTPSTPTGSTVNTPSSNSPSATSKKAPARTHPIRALPRQRRLARLRRARPQPHPLDHHPRRSATSHEPTTIRTRLIAVPAVIVNRSGRPTLRLPTRWPWATNFTSLLAALRALPGPSG